MKTNTFFSTLNTYNPTFQTKTEQHKTQNNILTMAKVYHQTGQTAAIAILTSQNMLRGSSGLVGGGIYFASAPPQTRGKAHDTGVMLKCSVQLGNTKHIDATKYRQTKKKWPQLSHSSLKKDGFDSATITGLDTGAEFVVYNSSQVRKIEWHGGTDVRHQVNSSSSGEISGGRDTLDEWMSNSIKTCKADQRKARKAIALKAEQRKAIALKAKQKKKPVMKTNIFGQRYCVKKKKGSNLTGSDGRKWKAMARKNWDAALF